MSRFENCFSGILLSYRLETKRQDTHRQEVLSSFVGPSKSRWTMKSGLFIAGGPAKKLSQLAVVLPVTAHKVWLHHSSADALVFGFAISSR